MASAPQPTLPLFYQDLTPLNTRDHAGWKTKPLDSVPFLRSQHAVPLTIEEFVETQRYYPIVFSAGENPLPLALMGLNEGVNTFVDDQGKVTDAVYLPAYVRRYPFLLAKLRNDSDDMSLCFDPKSGSVGELEGGVPLFAEDNKPSEHLQNVLKFCERFEEAAQRTKAFIEELKKQDLLMDGEISITQNEDPDKPFVYRGFRMVDENKLKNLPADVVENWNKTGLLILIHAHLFSLNLMRMIFARQVQQGKMPDQPAA